MAGFDLSDEEWAAIEPLIPGKGRGPARKDDRTMLTGVFYIWKPLKTVYFEVYSASFVLGGFVDARAWIF